MIERLRGEANQRCVICQLHGAPYVRAADASEQDCPRCGRFKITGTGFAVLNAEGDLAVRTRLSHYVRRNNDLFEIIPRITDDVLNSFHPPKALSIEDRVETLFAYLKVTTLQLGDAHEITDPALDGAAGSLINPQNHDFSSGETVWLLEMLEERGWLREQDDDYEITPAGYAAWDQSSKERMGQRVGFVAMAFNQPLSIQIEGGARRAITAAGYEPFVVSDAEHIGRIDDLIVSSLRTARFLVADLTYQRQNVYWEAGFCAGRGTPVFLACQDAHVRDLHFDVRQYNAVVWTNAGDLATKLQRRIEAILGKGPL